MSFKTLVSYNHQGALATICMNCPWPFMAKPPLGPISLTAGQTFRLNNRYVGSLPEPPTDGPGIDIVVLKNQATDHLTAARLAITGTATSVAQTLAVLPHYVSVADYMLQNVLSAEPPKRRFFSSPQAAPLPDVSRLVLYFKNWFQLASQALNTEFCSDDSAVKVCPTGTSGCLYGLSADTALALQQWREQSASMSAEMQMIWESFRSGTTDFSDNARLSALRSTIQRGRDKLESHTFFQCLAASGPALAVADIMQTFNHVRLDACKVGLADHSVLVLSKADFEDQLAKDWDAQSRIHTSTRQLKIIPPMLGIQVTGGDGAPAGQCEIELDASKHRVSTAAGQQDSKDKKEVSGESSGSADAPWLNPPDTEALPAYEPPAGAGSSDSATSETGFPREKSSK